MSGSWVQAQPSQAEKLRVGFISAEPIKLLLESFSVPRDCESHSLHQGLGSDLGLARLHATWHAPDSSLRPSSGFPAPRSPCICTR